jgi:PKHD-type hydroxylase
MLIVIEQLLNAGEVKALRQQLDAADWADGAATAGTLARGVKRNEQLPEHTEQAQRLGHEVLRKLGGHPLFISAALPRRIYPPRFNRYQGGGTYGTHVDSAVMQIPGTAATMRSDLSATLFLAAPHEYEGGELQVEGAFGSQSYKLAAGDMLLYPANSLHRVTPVTRGARVASFFWIESLVPDEAQRTLLFDLDQSVQQLTRELSAGHAEVLRLSGIYHNLLRRWVQT